MRENRCVAITLLLLLIGAPCMARHFEMPGSGEVGENPFGVAISLPYEGGDPRYGRILRERGFSLGAGWFIVSHWDTSLAWSKLESTTDTTGNPIMSAVDLETRAALRQCDQRGIKTMVTLAFSNPLYFPDWLYTPDSPENCDGIEQWCFYVRSADEPGGTHSFTHDDPDIGNVNTTYICAEWLARYMKYCKTMAEYYGQYVDAWQVWEEENWVSSGNSEEGSCACKAEFFRPYPPYATEDDWRHIVRLYAEMLINVAPFMKRLTPDALVLFGATCGCDTPYIEAVVGEAVGLGATTDFFEQNLDGFGFHGFRTGVWRSGDEWYRGAPELEVPSPMRYTPTDVGYGSCSMYVHYQGHSRATMSFIDQVADLRARLASLTGLATDAIDLYCTEDCAPFHYEWGCKEHKRGFVSMSKYLGRSFLTCLHADVYPSHWQMQEGDAGDNGVDYGLINRTHQNSGCRYTEFRPYMEPELRRQAYYTLQALAGVYCGDLKSVDAPSAGVALFDASPSGETLPLTFQSVPERSNIATGNEELTVMVHVPDAGGPSGGKVLLCDWKMTDFPLTVGNDYVAAPGLAYVRENEELNPNTMAVWVRIDLSTSELEYDTTIPPEVWELSTLPQGDFESLAVSCPERPLSYELDPGNPSAIVIERATLSDYVNIIEISPAVYPAVKVAGTLDSYLDVGEGGVIAGNIWMGAMPRGGSFVEGIEVFYQDIDLGISMNDRGEGADASAGDGLFTALISAPGTAPGPPNSLIASGARHPIVFAAGISQNAMFAGESGSFVVSAYVFDADNSSDHTAVASCQMRIPGTTFTFPMTRSDDTTDPLGQFLWTASVKFDDLSGVEPGAYPLEVVATDGDGLSSVPWPHIPTGDGTYIPGLYLNLRIKGKGDVVRRCWPELRVQ